MCEGLCGTPLVEERSQVRQAHRFYCEAQESPQQQELQVIIFPDIVLTKTLVIHITCTIESCERVYTSRLIVPCRSFHCRLMFVFTCRVILLWFFPVSVSVVFRFSLLTYFSSAFGRVYSFLVILLFRCL